MQECVEVYNREQLISTILVDYSASTVQVQNYIEPVGLNVGLLPFGKNTSPVWRDYIDFLRYRCFEETRPDAKILLKHWGLDYYDPDKLVRKTHGVLFGDFIWVKFGDENITFEDVRIR